jgi:hypothetical protein
MFQTGRALFAASFMLVSSLAYSLTPKMDVPCSSEMLVDFQQTTQHYLPEERALQNNYRLYLNINSFYY